MLFMACSKASDCSCSLRLMMAIFSVKRRGWPFVFFDSAESAVLLLLRCAITTFKTMYNTYWRWTCTRKGANDYCHAYTQTNNQALDHRTITKVFDYVEMSWNSNNCIHRGQSGRVTGQRVFLPQRDYISFVVWLITMKNVMGMYMHIRVMHHLRSRQNSLIHKYTCMYLIHCSYRTGCVEKSINTKFTTTHMARIGCQPHTHPLVTMATLVTQATACKWLASKKMFEILSQHTQIPLKWTVLAWASCTVQSYSIQVL